MYRNNLKIQGKLRSKTQEISTRTADVVLSVGALNRAFSSEETLQEVYRYKCVHLYFIKYDINKLILLCLCTSSLLCIRMLRSGGLFVFVEPTKLKSGSTTLELIEKVFPKDILPSPFSRNNDVTNTDDSRNNDVTNTDDSRNNNDENDDEDDIDNLNTIRKKSNKKAKKSSATTRTTGNAGFTNYKSRKNAFSNENENSDTNVATASIISPPSTQEDSETMIKELVDTTEGETNDKGKSNSNGAVLKAWSTWDSNELTAPSNSKGTGTSNAKMTKPGLVFEIINNVVDSYVTGIAVKG